MIRQKTLFPHVLRAWVEFFPFFPFLKKMLCLYVLCSIIWFVTISWLSIQCLWDLQPQTQQCSAAKVIPSPSSSIFSQSLAVWEGSTNLSFVFRGQGGITEGLVKGALYVATSAYKALFTGPNCSIQVGEWRLSSQNFPLSWKKSKHTFSPNIEITLLHSRVLLPLWHLSDQMEAGCFGSPWLWHYACFLPVFPINANCP